MRLERSWLGDLRGSEDIACSECVHEMRVDKSEFYSHSVSMALVDISSHLAAPVETVWAAVKTPTAFRRVTRRLLTMPVIRNRSTEWREGETVTGWVFLFGFVPFSRHVLHIFLIDDVSRTLVSRERGGLLKKWDHTITVVAADSSSCVYRDRVEIDAGVFTAPVVLYAKWFYRMRQRRWRRWAKEMRSS